MKWNIKSLQSGLIWAISALLVLMVVINIAVYSFYTRNFYKTQIQDASNMLVNQVGISYETVLSYMADSINKIAIYDFKEIDTSGLKLSAYDFHTAMTRQLTSIVTLNSYIHSAYIYIPDTNVVYNSLFNYPRVSSLDEFFDKEFLTDTRPNYLLVAQPRRILESPSLFRSVEKTVISIVSPIAFERSDETPYIVLNIDADKLYKTILNNINMNGEVTLYAYNSDNTILMHSNMPELMFTEARVSTEGIHSSYYSGYLGWTFILESPLVFNSYRFPEFILINLLSLFLAILAMVLFIMARTKPVHKLTSEMAESVWKDVLNDRVTLSEEMIAQISGSTFEDSRGYYGVVTVEATDGTFSVLSLPENIERIVKNLAFQHKTVQTEKNRIAFVLKYKEPVLAARQHALAESIYAELPGGTNFYIGTSGAQDAFSFIPLLYKESVQALNYKICLNTRVLDYLIIKESESKYDYPDELARQLINNIIAGNSEVFPNFIKKIFAPFDEGRIIIDDTQFHNLMISLQNNVLKTISGLPVPVKVDYLQDLTGIFSIEELKSELTKFGNRICAEVNLLDENHKYRLYSAAMEYINQNFFLSTFSLTQAAEELSINKNYLSRIVREMTGMSFTEYVNKNRIDYSKTLMKDKSKSIEEISAAVGFNYAYYFIKVFKSLEGITPGQYQASLAEELS